MTKILIIENQYTQFKKITKRFDSSTFEVYPIDYESYKIFMDQVRVFVNTKYPPEYRDGAIEEIIAYINGEDIDLILMDHILGGAHHCLTGIDLAEKINEERKDDLLPVLFLSKTELNDEKRVKRYEKYKEDFGESHNQWVHKGFYGDEILGLNYFKERVLKKVTGLLGESKSDLKKKSFEEIIQKHIDDFRKTATDLKDPDYEEYAKILEDLKRNYGKLSDEFILYISNSEGNRLDKKRIENEKLKINE